MKERYLVILEKQKRGETLKHDEIVFISKYVQLQVTKLIFGIGMGIYGLFFLFVLFKVWTGTF
jgi:hypothetical protein